jgi:RNA recognition motif-containing protein
VAFNVETDEDDLKALFSQYGRVMYVTIRENSSKGGYGFIVMPNESEANRAITDLNGALWHGRRLKVNKKRDRRDYEGDED